jgi:hypothetical protein
MCPPNHAILSFLIYIFLSQRGAFSPAVFLSKKKGEFVRGNKLFSVLRLLANLVDSRPRAPQSQPVEPRDPGTTHPFQFQDGKRRNVPGRGWARAHMERLMISPGNEHAGPQRRHNLPLPVLMPPHAPRASMCHSPPRQASRRDTGVRGRDDGSQSDAALDEKPSADLVPCRTREPPTTDGDEVIQAKNRRSEEAIPAVVLCNPTPPRQGYPYFRAFCFFSFGLCLSSEPTSLLFVSFLSVFVYLLNPTRGRGPVVVH